MYTDQEINDVRGGLLESLKERLEAGHRVMPSGFAFHTVPAKRVCAVHGSPFRGKQDLDRFTSAVRTMALAGRAQAVGVALVTDSQILPSCDFETDEVAVVYLDRLQGHYEVWYAPVMRLEGSVSVGDFIRLDDTQLDVLYILPMDLYGPIGHA